MTEFLVFMACLDGGYWLITGAGRFFSGIRSEEVMKSAVENSSTGSEMTGKCPGL